ncbi:MAG: sporulation integral membrane protein YtvI, partial [Bacillota bacterium]
YTFPFVAAFLIAFLIQPVTKFFGEKLKLSRSAPSLLASLLVYLVFFSLLAFLFYQIIHEAKLLLVNLPAVDLELVMEPLTGIIEQVGQYFKDIDPAFIEKNSNRITDLITGGFDVLGASLSAFLEVAMSIPVWIMVLFVIMISTYFFSRDMSEIKKRAISIFSDRGRESFFTIWVEGIKMLTKYIKAYATIYLLTFVQTLIGFALLGVKYAVMLSIVCAVADIFPILGIGLVYLPLAAIYFIAGDYFTGAALIVLYIIISVVRQIVEPKIVSSSLGIHPVLILAVIFIGLQAYGFIGMIYLTLLIVFYKIFKAARVL